MYTHTYILTYIHTDDMIRDASRLEDSVDIKYIYITHTYKHIHTSYIHTYIHTYRQMK